MQEPPTLLEPPLNAPGQPNQPDPSLLAVSQGAHRAGMLALSQAVNGADPLETTLTNVARITVLAVFGADGAGVTVLDPDGESLIAASDPFVREIDTIQYAIHEGPCLSAIVDDTAVRSGTLLTDKRWPKFISRIGNLGVNRANSVMSLPLRVPGQMIGSLNIYARAENAFNGDSVRRGEQFAAAAAVAVSNMHMLAQVRRHVAQLEQALRSRPTIDQAIGIIRSRTGGTADEAFGTLQTMSQRDNKKLALVAEQLLEQSTRRARTRHIESEQ